MADDNKHQKTIAVRLTDREALAAMRECVRLDKKPAELIRYAFRMYLFGIMGMEKDGRNENSSDE